METSDSECFESADEDFEEENKCPKIDLNFPSNLETQADVASQIKNVTINETISEEIFSNTVIPNKSVVVQEKEKVSTKTEARNRKREQRMKKEVKPKAGSKLGQKIPCSTVKEQFSAPSNKDECLEPADNILEKCDETKIDNESSIKTALVNCDSTGAHEPTTKNVDQEENLWCPDDEWEAIPDIKSATEMAQSTNKLTGWGGWGNWGGVSNMLSTATQSVTTLTNHVSQGISTVLESGIGVPDPEELAKLHKQEKSRESENIDETEDEGPTIETVFGLGNLVSGVSHITRLVETTSSKVLTGGLDTLEIIGKKTMEVLQEGDPGLKNKRAFLKIQQDKPVLSQLLREAKEKAEEENRILEDRHFQMKANYETLFDDNQGLVHLEALEMLSKQCDIKLETIMSSYAGQQLIEMQETMNQVKELCEIPDEDDEEAMTKTEMQEKLRDAVDELNVPINYEKLNLTWEETETWLSILNLDICNERELHQQGIETLAHLTALAVEQFHKAGELLLVKEHRSTADEADSLVQLTTILTALIGVVAAKFSEKLSSMASKANDAKMVNELMTNVFLEAANSSSYIQDAFKLLIPVLQVGAI